MTIKDIARESGYAVGTVSRVLNNNPRVSEDARRKILAVVAQHGYQPNANAKHLKQQVPEGLALIVKGTQNALFADLLDKLQPCLEARGYTPTVYYNNVSTDELACAQTIFAERRPCGLFFIGAHPQCFTPALASLGIPCLLLTNNAAGLGIENLSSVSVDDRAAAAVMIEQLYAKDHRVIGIIGDRPETSRPSQQRLDGCLDALQRLGVPFDFDRQYRLADFSMQGGYAAAEHLLEHCPGLTAIFAMSDLMAVGAIRAIQDHGLRVPQDIAVAGYDGIALGRKLRQIAPDIVLVYISAYLEFAPQGYTVNAYRYLLKRDIAAQLPSCLEDIFSGMSDLRKTLEVHHNRTTSEIPLDQIYYLESDLRQINVYGDIPHQPICTFYGKIADLPAMLYENGFLQVGRSDVVNLQYVRSIRNYKVELRSGVELSVSRQYYTAIRSAWLEWKGQFGDE